MNYLVLILIALIFVFPIVFMIVSSLKPDMQLLRDSSSLRAFLPVGDISLNNYSAAFDDELKKFLKALDPDEVSSNNKAFYKKYLEEDKEIVRKIRFNKDILHQSKLVNYFNGDYAKSKIEKDLNNFLKKIKKDKKYILSKKDIILIESIKSDGIEISKKYENLYEINESEMPTDIQVMINNNEVGSTILRIIEVIGQDNLETLDEDTLYFIISALNQLDIDNIRNKILLKVLPLKV